MQMQKIVRTTYTIGALARAASVPTTTVRYYERLGLLMPEGRTRARYRCYGPAALERIHFIRAHQRRGLTLENIAELLSLNDGRTSLIGHVQQMLTRRLEKVDQSLRELRRTRTAVLASLECCKHAGRHRNAAGICPGQGKWREHALDLAPGSKL